MGAAWCLSTVGRYSDPVPSPLCMTARPEANSYGDSGTKLLPLMRLPNLRSALDRRAWSWPQHGQLDEELSPPALALPGFAAQAFHSPPIVSTRKRATELSCSMGAPRSR